MTQSQFNPRHVAFVSTYPPRQCGIGTFTSDLLHSLEATVQTGHTALNERAFEVLALNNVPGDDTCLPEVHFTIRDQNRVDYQEAANFINLTPVQVVSLQHEYGIYGGEDGAHVLTLLEHIRKPVVTTLHTVLETPTQGQLDVLKSICRLSTLVVVLAHHAVQILQEIYDVPDYKIMYIPHGVPDVPFLDSSFYKDQFKAEGRTVLLTFGFLSPGKGIEYAIQAMPEIVKDHPDVLYIILGATHPEVKRQFGEKYRISLENLVQDLDLQNHVQFQNRFVSLEQLIQFLVASDIYLSPSLGREQIVSGTLSYALGCGKCTISTASFYAEEALSEERGLIVPFQDSHAFTESVLKVMGNDLLRNRLRKNAYQHGRQMIWREVAGQYANAFEDAITLFGRESVPASAAASPLTRPSLPEVKMDHFYTLTDDTGILQHAIFTVPNRYHGYCTDDNVRALIVTIMHWRLFNDPKILRYIHIFLSFLHYALHPSTGRMRNMMAYDRKWIEDVGSEDSHARTIWGLGYCVNYAPTEEILGHSNTLFKQCMPAYKHFIYPRPLAYCILGGVCYLDRFGGDTETRQMVSSCAERLKEMFDIYHEKSWPWCEDILTYANARIPQGLIAAGALLKDDTMLQSGLNSLRWLIDIQTHPEAYTFSFIGNSEWYRKGRPKSRYDQQPIEAAGMIEACYQAYLATGDAHWTTSLETGFHWFLGKNDINQSLYDFKTGGCFDGIQPGGLNMNQGAESLLSWLQALHLMWLM